MEKDLYDKLGIKIETEVIPLDAFVPKTLLEFNSGSSPWDLIMFGPSNMPDYGRHFEPLEPWVQKLKLDFLMDDIADVYKKLMLRHAGKIVSMPYDGDVHIMFWNKVAFERPRSPRRWPSARRRRTRWRRPTGSGRRSPTAGAATSRRRCGARSSTR